MKSDVLKIDSKINYVAKGLILTIVLLHFLKTNKKYRISSVIIYHFIPCTLLLSVHHEAIF